jgi:thiol-disulfide isomerase/thioredoxin
MTKKNTPHRFRTIQPGRMVKYPNLKERFRGIPTDLDTFRIYTIDFQLPQRYYQDFRNGDIDSATYQAFTKGKRIDEKQLSPTPIKQQVYVLAGLRKSQKVIICDANNDNNFAGEEVMQVSTADKNKKYAPDSLKGVYVSYEYYLHQQVRPLRTLLKIVPYDPSFSFKDSLENELNVFLTVAEYGSAQLSINGEQYEVCLRFPQSIFGNNYSRADVYIYDAKGKSLPIFPPLKMGDSYRLQGKFSIKFDLATELGDSLRIIQYPAKDDIVGFRVGERIEKLDFQDLTGATVAQHNGKPYTVLDFWGTWCGPCIAGLPQLKAFYETYKDRLTLVSVAYDRDKNKVKQFIDDKQMPWLHKFEVQGSLKEDDWVKILRVECYPTFILIDNRTNKILLRECGEDKIKVLASFLENQRVDGVLCPTAWQ